MLELCNERGLIAGNTSFKKKLIHKYTWEREGDVKRSMINFISVEELMRRRLIDVTPSRGVAGGISDHFLVECKVKRCARKEYVNRDRCIKEIVKLGEFEQKEIRDGCRVIDRSMSRM